VVQAAFFPGAVLRFYGTVAGTRKQMSFKRGILGKKKWQLFFFNYSHIYVGE
jgi:hypothetical protein